MLYTWTSWLLEQPHLWEAPPVEEVPAPAEPKPDWRKAAAHALQASEHAEAERQTQVCELQLVVHLKLFCRPCIQFLACSSHK